MTPRSKPFGSMTHNTNACRGPGDERTLDIPSIRTHWSQLSAGFGKFGDAFRMSATVTGAPIYVFSHPEHVRRVLVDNHQNYTKGIGIERVGILLGKGLMVSEGEFVAPPAAHDTARVSPRRYRAHAGTYPRALTRHCSRNG